MEKRLAAHEKVERDRLVVADRARGLTWPTIGARHGLSERQCRTIWTESLSRHDLPDADPFEVVGEVLAQWDSLIERLALLAEEADQDSVRVAALRAQADALRTRLILCQAVGLLPRDLGLFRHEADVRAVARAILSVFDEHHVPDDAVAAVREELDRASVFQRPNEPREQHRHCISSLTDTPCRRGPRCRWRPTSTPAGRMRWSPLGPERVRIPASSRPQTSAL